MPKFILGYGYRADAAIGDFPTEADALQHARDLSISVGVDPEMLDDCAWACPYDAQKAQELGLIVPDEPASFRQAWDRVNRGPW